MRHSGSSDSRSIGRNAIWLRLSMITRALPTAQARGAATAAAGTARSSNNAALSLASIGLDRTPGRRIHDCHWRIDPNTNSATVSAADGPLP